MACVCRRMRSPFQSGSFSGASAVEVCLLASPLVLSSAKTKMLIIFGYHHYHAFIAVMSSCFTTCVKANADITIHF